MTSFRRLAFTVLCLSVAAPALPAGAQTQPEVRVRIDRADKVGQTPLWIPLRVTVTEGEGDRPLAVDHLVFAGARNGRGDEAGPFNLGPRELEGARGVHEGFVIVPYGGPWTITAVVHRDGPEAAAGPDVLGRGTAEMAADGPVPAASAPAVADTSGRDGPKSEPFGVSVLWIHTMVAIGWALAVALLALLALPAGRRLLSEQGSIALDGRLDRIARGVWWLTGLVVATGIYNLVNSVPYRVPLSPDEASRLFRLPYARPYYLALGVKLAVYAVMIGASIALLGEARRRAAVAESAVPAGAVDVDDRSPWENPTRISDGDPAGSGRVALRRKTAAQVLGAVDVDQEWLAVDATGGRARTLVTVLVTGGTVIVAAVTLLKYLHLLSEVSRLSG
jgi:hypothetical protein